MKMMSGVNKGIKWLILRENTGRIRLEVSFKCTPAVQSYLHELAQQYSAIQRVKFYLNEHRLSVYYEPGERDEVLAWLDCINVDELYHIYQDKQEFTALNPGKIVTSQLCKRWVYLLCVPKSLRIYWTLGKSTLYLLEAWRYLRRGQLTMEVLDCAAVFASIGLGEVASAGRIMFILELGERLDEWTISKSIHDLTSSLDQEHFLIWVENEQGRRYQVMTQHIQVGDHIVVQEGEQIHFDGRIIRGSGSTQESNLTGEPFPVPRQVGDEVYSNTTLESGEIVVEVTDAVFNSRLEELVKAIHQSLGAQSANQARLYHRADSLVKYNFLGLAITYFLTRNWGKALSFLLVDFSCAIKLSTSVTYLTALREAMEAGVIIKGSNNLDLYGKIDTFVFDKTGTLTESKLSIAKVAPFAGHSYQEVLSIGACLEEHLYHPIAQAVVDKARDEGITHEEMHGPLVHIASRGIKSSIDGDEVLIGSEAFIHSEGVCLTQEQIEFADDYRDLYNLLYLARAKELIAIFCIDTPLRENAIEVLSQLKSEGKRIVLLTGDTPERSRLLQESVDFDEVKTQVTPQDKVTYITTAQQAGHNVLMIGDGLNDSIAITQADIGVVMGDASDIARQVSDIIFINDDLSSLYTLKDLNQRLDHQLSRNLHRAIGINSSLIGLGLMGWMSGSMLATLHNLSTVLIVADSFKLEAK